MALVAEFQLLAPPTSFPQGGIIWLSGCSGINVSVGQEFSGLSGEVGKVFVLGDGCTGTFVCLCMASM